MTDSLPKERLDELDALARAATPGPWEDYRPNDAYRIYEVCSTSEQRLVEAIAEVSGYNAGHDAALIAALDPDTVRALIAQARRAAEAGARAEAAERARDKARSDAA